MSHSSERSSINLDLLDKFLAKAATAAVSGDSNVGDVASLLASIRKACDYGSPAGTAVISVESMLEVWSQNTAAAQVIRNALADKGSGVVEYSNAELTAALNAAGAATAPEVVEFLPSEILGMAPTSGFADDPVCMANGNFVLLEEDLVLAGYASGLSLRRTYNSLSSEKLGRFGRGWSTLLDMKLEVFETEKAQVVMPDGSLALLTPTNSEKYEYFCTRRDLGLRIEQGQWILEAYSGESWRFSSDGSLAGGTSDGGNFEVEDTPSGVAVQEELSGRSVEHYLDDAGLITLSKHSDGREVHYWFDDKTCAGVRTPAGGFRYSHDDVALTVRRDADDVATFENAYDDSGRLLSQKVKATGTSRYEYQDHNASVVVYESSPQLRNLYVHDDRGNLKTFQAADGRGHRMTWDGYDRRASLTSRTGGTITSEYLEGNRGNRVTRQVDQIGQSQSWEYDQQHRVVKHKNPVGGLTQFEYVGDNPEPVVEINPLGGRTNYLYGTNNKLALITDADGVQTSFSWSRDGLISKVVNGNRSFAVTYDKFANLASLTDYSNVTMKWQRDDAGRVINSSIDTGPQIDLTYSEAGRETGATSNGQQIWVAEYDDAGRVSTIRDKFGSQQTFGYDYFGRVTQVDVDTGENTKYVYDKIGNLTSVEDQHGNISSQTFDRAGAQISVSDENGVVTSRQLDKAGRTIELELPGGDAIQFEYDKLGKVSVVRRGDKILKRRYYDANGSMLSEFDGDGNESAIKYSAAGRVLSQTSLEGRERHYEYDAEGQLVATTDSDGVKLRTLRDRLGRVSNVTSETGSSPTLSFDELGRLAGWESPIANFEMQRDTAGRVVRLGHPGYGAALRSFDGHGALEYAADSAQIRSDFQYDQSRRLSEAITGAQTVKYGYDELGMLAEICLGSNIVHSFRKSSTGRAEAVFTDGDGFEIGYDSAGRIAELNSMAGNNLLRYAYGPDGQVSSVSNGHGVVNVRRDLNGATIETTNLDGGSISYQRDRDGLVKERREGDCAVTYRRSAAGRIESFEAAGVMIDRPSSLISQRDSSGRVAADPSGYRFGYDDAGRLTSCQTGSGIYNCAYDENGRLASEQAPWLGARSFAYNDSGQLVAANNTQDNTSVTFTYDRAGRRIAQQHSDGSGSEFEWDELGQLTKVNRVSETGVEIVSEIIYSGFRRPEIVGGISIGWDDAITGKVVSVGPKTYVRFGMFANQIRPTAGEWSAGTYDDPWGYQNGKTGCGLGFRNELRLDELHFMGARVYDAEHRCFLSPDPVAPIAGALCFASPYAYGWNDPINFVDPSGKLPVGTVEYNLQLLAERKDQRGLDGWAWDEVVVPGVKMRTIPERWLLNQAHEKIYTPISVTAFKSAFGHPIPRDFIDNYSYGNGAPVHLTADQMSELAVDVDIMQSEQAVQTLADLEVIGGGEVDLNFTGSETAGTNGTLGFFPADYDGTLQVDTSGTETSWRFDGDMNFNDTYDFDKSTHRPFLAESMTTAGRVFLPGEPFKITSDDVPISQSDSDSEAQWAGTNVEGQPNRISNEENEGGASFNEDETAGKDFGTAEINDDGGGL